MLSSLIKSESPHGSGLQGYRYASHVRHPPRRRLLQPPRPLGSRTEDCNRVNEAFPGSLTPMFLTATITNLGTSAQAIADFLVKEAAG